MNDLGILTLPDQTPVPGQPAGRLVAPYYGPNSGFQLYSGNGPLVGQNVTLVGYGDTGAGATGETNDEVQQISITNPTAATMFTLNFNGGAQTKVVLPINATAAQVAAALGTLLTIGGSDDIAVNTTGLPPNTWDVRFINSLGNQALGNQPVAGANLLGGTITAGGGAFASTQVLWSGHGSGLKYSGQNQFTKVDPNRPNVLQFTYSNLNQAMIAHGDSGGPALTQQGPNGMWQIAAVASFISSPGAPGGDVTDYIMGDGSRYPDSSEGETGSETSVAPYLNNFINTLIPASANYTGGNYGLVLDMNDQVLGLDGINDNITITAQNVNGNLVLNVNDPSSPIYSGVYYSAPAANITSLTIRASTQTANNDIIELDGPLALGPGGTGSITIEGGIGHDTVIVGSAAGGNLDDLTGPLTVNGDGVDGSLDLVVNDTAAPVGHTYTVTGTTIARDGAATITYQGVLDTLVLNTSSLADVVNVQGTTTNVFTIINTGGGNDVINVGSTLDATSTLDAINGTLKIHGDAGTDTLNVNDPGAAAGHTYTVTANSVTRDGVAAIGYSDVENINVIAANTNLGGANSGNIINIQGTFPGVTTVVNGGDGDSTFNVLATATGSTTVLNGGLGNDDTFTVGSTNDASSTLDAVLGAVNVNGGGGDDDTLNVNDPGAAVGHTYTVTANSVTRDGAPAIGYSSVENLNRTGGSHGNVVNVQSTHAGTATLIKSGTGSDTVTVGSGPPIPNRIDGILGALTIDTQAGAIGSDMIIIDDSGSQGPYQYRATATTIVRVGGPTITTLNSKNRLLKAAVGGSITQIVSNPTGTTLTVAGGAAGVNTSPSAVTATRSTTCRGRSS